MELSKSDLTQVSPISGSNTLRVLPMGKHKTQRIVVGDSEGQLLCFAWKKGAAKNEWRIGSDQWKSSASTKASARSSSSDQQDYSILALTLAGDKGDKCFLSQKNGLTGVNKKGAIFYDFVPLLADPITSLAVSKTHLHTASLYSYTLFEESREMHHVMAPGEIHSLALLPRRSPDADSYHTSLLGCEDRMIRVCQGGMYLQEIPVEAAAMSMCSSMESSHGCRMFYGLENGTVGCLQENGSSSSSSLLSEGKSEGSKEEEKEGSSSRAESSSSSSSSSSSTLTKSWKIKHPSRSSVNCLSTWDPYKDGIEHLVAGRDDGSIEIFDVDALDKRRSGSENFATFNESSFGGRSGREQDKKFSTQLNESIRALDVGAVVSPSYDELVVATFTGRVCTFTTESLSKVDPNDKYGRSKLQLRNEGLITETKKEINSLKKQVSKEVDKYQKKYAKTGDKHNGSSILGNGSEGTAIHNFHVNLDASTAKYTCKVELATPIHYVVLVGDVMGAMVTGTSKSVGDVSIQHTVPEVSEGGSHGNSLLATIRPATNELSSSGSAEAGGSPKVLEWCIRPVEGQYGEVKIFVVSSGGGGGSSSSSSSSGSGGAGKREVVATTKSGRNSSNATTAESLDLVRKRAMELKMTVKPLSLHQIEHSLIHPINSNSEHSEHYSKLNITGPFSAERAHGWISQCFPGVAPQMADSTSEKQLFFKNTLFGTRVCVTYEKGRVFFQSGNLSTLSILKDYISNDALATSMKIQMSTDISKMSARHMMSLLKPMIEAQFNLSRDVHLVGALKEAVGEDATSDSLSYLDPRLIRLLRKCEDLKNELKQSPGLLRMLFGVVTDLFIDMHMFRGQKFVHFAGKLSQMLQDYNHDTVVEWMHDPS